MSDTLDTIPASMVVPGTKILMADWSFKNIENIRNGEAIICIQEESDYKKQKRIEKGIVKRVTRHCVDNVVNLRLENGEEVGVTPNSRILTGRNQWSLVKHLRPKTGMLSCYKGVNDAVEFVNCFNKDYARGYFVTMWITDGSVRKYTYNRKYKKKTTPGEYYRVRLAVKDQEIIWRMRMFCDAFNVDYTIRKFKISTRDNLEVDAIFSGKKKDYDYIMSEIEYFYQHYHEWFQNVNYVKGFLAAFYDAEGHMDKTGKTISVANTDLTLLSFWRLALKRMGFKVSVSASKGGHRNRPCYRSAIVVSESKYKDPQIAFFSLVCPAVMRKAFATLLGTSRTRRVVIDDIKKEEKVRVVYGLETSSNTFITNGAIMRTKDKRESIIC